VGGSLGPVGSPGWRRREAREDEVVNWRGRWGIGRRRVLRDAKVSLCRAGDMLEEGWRYDEGCSL
jgi:hypothetical protein